MTSLGGGARAARWRIIEDTFIHSQRIPDGFPQNTAEPLVVVYQ